MKIAFSTRNIKVQTVMIIFFATIIIYKSLLQHTA